MKERASTLVFQPHYHYTIHSCGALCTYSLYDKQVNGAALSIPYWSFVTSGRFPVARAFSLCAEPQRGRWREEDKKTRSVLFYWFPNLLLLKAALSRLDVGPAYYEDPAFPSRAYLVLVLRFELDPLTSPYQRKPCWCALAHFRFPFTSRGSRGSYAAAFPGPFLLVLRPEAIASS
ncbi:hypothetical protein VNO78_35227 [Psophocarpus tetragonolobus]|uniref:Uncharacterized protein n=1 Tax=Psophocarpus tetragonolobus TaxID=3891 RepID=A0AAN9NNB7_PSOTE